MATLFAVFQRVESTDSWTGIAFEIAIHLQLCGQSSVLAHRCRRNVGIGVEGLSVELRVQERTTAMKMLSCGSCEASDIGPE